MEFIGPGSFSIMFSMLVLAANCSMRSLIYILTISMVVALSTSLFLSWLGSVTACGQACAEARESGGGHGIFLPTEKILLIFTD